MALIQHNFLVAVVDQNAFPDFLDWADSKNLSITNCLPGAVRLRDVVKTMLPGMDGNAAIPIVKCYAKASSVKWEFYRADWQSHFAALTETRAKASSGIIVTNGPIK